MLIASLLGVALLGCKSDKKEDKPATVEPTAEAPAKEADAPAEPAKEEPLAVALPPGHFGAALATVGPASESSVKGTVSFKTAGPELLNVELTLEGLTPGEHGFHIHETGDCSAPDAKSAGGHFNPAKSEHGGPGDNVHHAGDFGNITADASGKAMATWQVDWISLKDGADNFVGKRAVVVHAKPDDMKSQPSGAAGPRVGCGVIEISK